MNPQKYLPSWVIILLIVILSTIPPFSTDMFLPALPEMVKYFHTTEAVLNITLYGFMFFQAVSMLILGPISDKYGRKPILTLSIIAYIITSLLASVAPTIETFIICRMIQGAASGGMLVVSIALVKDCFEEESQKHNIYTDSCPWSYWTCCISGSWSILNRSSKLAVNSCLPGTSYSHMSHNNSALHRISSGR